MARTTQNLIAIWVFSLLAITPLANAAPGDVDPSFGFAGRVLNSFQQASAEILALAIQADGKIIAVGSIREGTPLGPSRFLIARHNANGSLDNSFGNDGRTITNFPAGESIATAVAIQLNGKIVVAGKAGNFFALARYNSDGTLDLGFGSSGVIENRFEPNEPNTLSLASSVALQPDGKIVVAGDSFLRNPAAPSFVTDCNVGVARFNPDGTLDQSFGIAGLVLSNFGSFDRADALAIQSDGKIIVAGDSNSTGTGPYTAFVLRYSATGTPDEAFGALGRAALIPGSFDSAAVALQLDGKIVVAGTLLNTFPANKDFAVARYNTDGSLDSSFGVSGIATSDFGWSGTASGRENVPASMIIQGDGGILLGGYAESIFGMARFTQTGSPDVGFGNNGFAVTQIGALGAITYTFPVAASSTFYSAGLSLVAGTGVGGGIVGCSLFQDCGVDLRLFLIEQAFALAIQPSGKIIAGGMLDKQAVLVRYHSTTTPKITVATRGAGLGAAWSPDGAISCGTRCSASYDAGSPVLLGWATPLGSYFSGWTGCTPVPGGGCALTLNADTTVTADFDLDVSLAANAEVLDLPDGVIGVEYSAQVALAGAQPFTSRVSSGSLPAGLILNGRMLSGTPSRAGKAKFTVDFTDAVGRLTKQRFSLTVFKTLTIATGNLKAGRIGRAYNFTLKPKGGDGPYTWSVIGGSLPQGFSLDSENGRVAGTTSVNGTYPLTFRVTDGLGQHSERSLSLTIN